MFISESSIGRIDLLLSEILLTSCQAKVVMCLLKKCMDRNSVGACRFTESFASGTFPGIWALEFKVLPDDKEKHKSGENQGPDDKEKQGVRFIIYDSCRRLLKVLFNVLPKV